MPGACSREIASSTDWARRREGQGGFQRFIDDLARFTLLSRASRCSTMCFTLLDHVLPRQAAHSRLPRSSPFTRARPLSSQLDHHPKRDTQKPPTDGFEVWKLGTHRREAGRLAEAASLRVRRM